MVREEPRLHWLFCSFFSASGRRLLRWVLPLFSDHVQRLKFAKEMLHHSDRSVKVDICGSENGHQVAWVTVNADGTITFINQQGLTASCILDNGLSVGSQCTVGEAISGHSSTTTSANGHPWTSKPLPQRHSRQESDLASTHELTSSQYSIKVSQTTERTPTSTTTLTISCPCNSAAA